MTLIKGIYLPADEEKAVELVEFDREDYRTLQGYTNGLFAVTEAFRPECSIFYSDEGKIHAYPMNRRASLFLWVHRTEFRGIDAIMGDAIILGPADDNGDTESVPDELVDLFFNTAEYKYLVKTINENGWHGNQRTYDNWVDAYNDGLGLATRWALVEHVKVVAA